MSKLSCVTILVIVAIRYIVSPCFFLDYSPIQLSSSSNIKLSVNYEMFVDLLQRSEQMLGPSDAISDTIKSSPSAFDSSTFQFIEFQFRLLRNSTGTILYSQTQSSIHNLQVCIRLAVCCCCLEQTLACGYSSAFVL